MVQRIKALCMQNGITPTKLEREIGLGKSTIRFWDDSPPSVDKVVKVATYFCVSVDYVLEITNDPQSHKSGADQTLVALKEVRDSINQKIETLEHQSDQRSGETE